MKYIAIVLYLTNSNEIYILFKGIPSGTKGITEEYTSPSGKKRTAKKEREEHIV